MYLSERSESSWCEVSALVGAILKNFKPPPEVDFIFSLEPMNETPPPFFGFKLRGVIKKFVDCLFEFQIPLATSMKYITILKHNIFRYITIQDFKQIINVFVSNSMTVSM